MKKKYFFAYTPIFIGTIFLIVYKINTRIDPDGTLREPFYLLPWGGLLIIIGFLLLLLIGINSTLKKQNNK
ncbi:DUF3955 domain-containing protein [Bacillus toyonensis]|uniref:DUF3955 domain-containing protein n=1 Tax=Bacillus toyonensis TaxID=155322 RepID=UPI003D65AA4A